MEKDKLNALFVKITSAQNESDILRITEILEKESKNEDLLEHMVLTNLLMTKNHELALLKVIESINVLLLSRDLDQNEIAPDDTNFH